MDIRRAVEATLQRFGCFRVTTLYHLLEMAKIISTKELLTINKETLKISHNNLSGAVYDAVNTYSHVDYGFMTSQKLDYMALALNFLPNIGVTPDATLLGTIDTDTALHFKKVVPHMADTKASTDSVELPNIPNNMQQNT